MQHTFNPLGLGCHQHLISPHGNTSESFISSWECRKWLPAQEASIVQQILINNTLGNVWRICILKWVCQGKEQTSKNHNNTRLSSLYFTSLLTVARFNSDNPFSSRQYAALKPTLTRDGKCLVCLNELRLEKITSFTLHLSVIKHVTKFILASRQGNNFGS